MANKWMQSFLDKGSTSVKSNTVRHPMPSSVTSNEVRKPISSRMRAIDAAFEAKSPNKENPIPSVTININTKGGDYPQYKKDSEEAADFRKAFAAARKKGVKKFSWQGRSYTTDTA